jgi:Tfp pilus assembly protein PilX
MNNKYLTNRFDNQEQGSVLVVVVGVLAVLAMMASAFLVTMKMQKEIGANNKYQIHAQMGALGGLQDAIGWIIDNSASGSTPGIGTNFNEAWFTEFNVPSTSAATNVTEVLPPAYKISGTEYLNKDYADASVKYNKGFWKDIINTGDGKIKYRYAIMTVDLSGRMPINLQTTTTTYKDVAPSFMCCRAYSTNSKTAIEDVYGKTLSPMHAIHPLKVANTSNDGNIRTIFRNTTVFPYSNTPATIQLGQINLNTAPRSILNALVVYSTENLSGTGFANTNFPNLNAIKTITEIGNAYGYNDSGSTDSAFKDLLDGNSLLYGSKTATTYDIDIAKALVATFLDSANGLPACRTPYAPINTASLSTMATTFKTNLNIVADIVNVYNGYDCANQLQAEADSYACKMEAAYNDVRVNIFGLTPEAIPELRAAIAAPFTPVSPSAQGGTAPSPFVYPKLSTAESNCFYIAVRAQSGKGTSNSNFKARAEKNLEAVLYKDGAEWKIIYKRWFDRQ